ncbi:MAG: MASE3 domain-containing protein [Patescibacteria group bacterium]|jgi:PAS domain S-box-containing protein
MIQQILKRQPTPQVAQLEFVNKNSIILQISILLLLLFATSFYSYILFHTLVEFVIALLSLAIFIVAWNARHFLENDYFLLIGIACLFTGALTIIHSFAYKGVNIINTGGDANLATQLWVASRFIFSFTFLTATLFIGKKIKWSLTFIIYFLVFLVLLMSIFSWHIFPDAYLAERGLTDFKIISEYVVIGAFALSLLLVYLKKDRFDKTVRQLIMWSLGFSVISEIFFINYFTVYDIFNLLGHLTYMVSIFLLYVGMVQIALMDPYRLMFRNLRNSERWQRRQKDFTRTIINNSADAILAYDKELRITLWNPSMERITGIKEKDALDRQASELLPYLREIGEESKLKEPLAGKQVHTTNRPFYIPTTGKQGYFEGYYRPLTDENGKIAGGLAFIRDITKAKEIERAKDEFVSLASHQLRTPLASISLSAELLLRQIAGATDERQKKYLEEIYRSSQGMSELIRTLLNVSRVELGNLPFKPEKINIIDLVNALLGELTGQISRKKLVLCTDYDHQMPVLNWDKNALKIIFENLLSNAIHYTPANGRITVSIHKKNNELTASVTDTGIGIPDKDKKNIFSKSFRTSISKELTPDGNGLGLYMIKKIADHFGGRIWFSSIAGQGTTFFVSLPLEDKKTVQPPSAPL